MKKEKKSKIDKFFKKFGKNKWLIDCEERYLEDLLKIFAREKVVWFDEKLINPRKNSLDLKQHKGYVFELKKRKHLQYNPREYYPYFHYHIFTFNEFLDLYRNACLKDSNQKMEEIECSNAEICD